MSRLRNPFSLADMGFVYGLLCTLSLALINPWGTPRGEIWTDPKVYVVIALAIFTWAVLLVAFVEARARRRTLPSPPAAWGWAALLWGTFLGLGLLSVYYSPVRAMNALMPNNEMGDGWVYWAYVAAFVLGNALLLRRFPSLFKPQFYGFLVAGLLMGLAVLVQTVDWRLDFTATTGKEVFTPNPRDLNLTYSNIYEGQMPIGLTSHRGHAGFVAAALAVLALVGVARGWVRGRYGWPLYLLLLGGVYLTSTRGVQVAFGAGLLYLLVRFARNPRGRRVALLAFVPLVLGGGALVGAAALGVPSVTRALPSWSLLFSDPGAFTSFRLDYWRVTLAGIRERPLLGWGFNGFGLAFPYVNDFDVRFARTALAPAPGKRNQVVRIETLHGTDHYYFRYTGTDGVRYLGRVISNKAHNIFLDVWVSLGLGGLVAYVLLFGLFLTVTARGGGWGLEAVGVVYLVYGLTWFESAQFSHLAWWALSAGLALQRSPKAVVAAVRTPFDQSFGDRSDVRRDGARAN